MQLTKDKGAILIILALSLSVLILFIALAVDTAVLGTSHQKQSRTAELGALAAVEAYLAGTGTQDQRLDAARLKAESVVGFTLNNLVGQRQTQQAGSGEIGDITNGARDRGTLYAGQYYFSEPVETCALFDLGLNNSLPGERPCPCPNRAWEGECFRPSVGSTEWDGLNGDDRPISAFRLDLNTNASSPLKTVFSQAGGGISEVSLYSTAISTVTPRHVVFLIDLSGSMTANSNRFPSESELLDPPYGPLSLFVNNCSGGNIAGNTGSISCTYPNDSSNNVLYYLPRKVWYGSTVSWPGMQECRDLSAHENIYTHYRDDYKCFTIDKDGNPATTSDIANYFVEDGYYTDGSDRTRINDTGIQYRGPEPLATVLSGVNETLRALSILSVPGDQITFIGHDQDVPSETGNPPRRYGPVSPGDIQFDELLRLTDHDGIDTATRDNTDGLTRSVIDQRIQAQLFPLPVADTDLSEAILRAYSIISKSPGVEISDNQIVIFGDGLGNCPHSNSTTAGTYVPYDYPDISTEDFLTSPSAGQIEFVEPYKACKDSTDPGVPPESEFENAFGCPAGSIGDETIPGCEQAGEAYNSYVEGFAYEKSTAEVVAMVTGQGRPLLPTSSPTKFQPFTKSGYKFHAFLFGKHIQPHTLLLKGVNGCMTEGDARENNKAFADSGDPLDVSISQSPYDAKENKPFVKPSYDFQSTIVAPTNGRFFPVRSPCTISALNGISAPGIPALTSNSDCLNGKGLDRLNEYCRNQTSVPVGSVIRQNINGILVNGRLVCDPYCRSQNEQVNLGISSLFQDNPIITVEPPPPLQTTTN